MYWCSKGDLLRIRLAIGAQVTVLAGYTHTPLNTWAIDNITKKSIRIPDGEIVMALEGSRPPFFQADMIRCLWKNRVVHIKRIDLVLASKEG